MKSDLYMQELIQRVWYTWSITTNQKKYLFRHQKKNKLQNSGHFFIKWSKARWLIALYLLEKNKTFFCFILLDKLIKCMYRSHVCQFRTVWTYLMLEKKMNAPSEIMWPYYSKLGPQRWKGKQQKEMFPLWQSATS